MPGYSKGMKMAYTLLVWSLIGMITWESNMEGVSKILKMYDLLSKKQNFIDRNLP